MGDFNKVDCSTALCNLTQYVSLPTRAHSLLDKFYCNVKNAYVSHTYGSIGMSDHNMVELAPVYLKKCTRVQPIKKDIHTILPDGYNQLIEIFNETEWSVLTADIDTDPNLALDIITQYIKFNQERVTTRKTITIYPNNKQWFDAELRALAVQKHKAFGTDSFVHIKKQLASLIKLKKRRYANKIEVLLSDKNVRGVYCGMKTIMGMTKTDCSGIDHSLGNQLNDFYARFDNCDFSSQRKQLEDKLRELMSAEEIGLFVVRPEDVNKLFGSLDRKKCAGPDGIKAATLYYCRDVLAGVIAAIFNKFITAATFPPAWKEAEIEPVPKNRANHDHNNYRPVALTSILAKCFEKIIKQWLLSSMEFMLDPHQFAYRAGKSTDDAVATLLHTVLHHLDKNSKNYARSVLLDFTSAFNTMQPHLLIQKMNDMGIASRLLLIILNFLENRPQWVRTTAGNSNTITISTGSPQNGVLSPLLFTIYTNDLRSRDSGTLLLKFADDVVITGMIDSITGERNYRATIKKCVTWCNDHNLQLNNSKTKEIVFDFRKGSTSRDNAITVNDVRIECVNECKYLGVMLDDTLSLTKHVDMVYNKMQKRMYMTKKLNYCGISKHLVRIAFRSFVESICIYCFPAFGDMLSKKNKRRYLRCCREADMMGICPLGNIENTLQKRISSLICNILKDSSHLLHPELSQFRVPSRRGWTMPFCRKTRYGDSLIPKALREWSGTIVS